MPVESAIESRSVQSRMADSVLTHHVPQGQSNDCGPYSAAMLINTFCTTKVAPFDLARELNQIRWIGPIPIIRRIPDWATFPWGVADALHQRRITASWHPFGSTAQLVRALNGGKIPVVFIGGYHPMWGHVMVLLASHPVRGWGFADPAWPTSDLHWISDKTFHSQWRAYANSWVEVKPN